ncbi:MAG: winged helix-turn-helix transcriptional regulator [Parvibaculales bacterium]
MLQNSFANLECPVGRSLSEVGDGWTLLIIREAIYGTTQFEAFLENTGASRGLLTSRLAQLVQSGILAKSKGEADGRETCYQLTPKGRDLWPVMLSLLVWSKKHLSSGDVVTARSRRTGAAVHRISAVDEAGNLIAPQDTVLVPGKDISDAFKARIEAAFF